METGSHNPIIGGISYGTKCQQCNRFIFVTKTGPALCPGCAKPDA